MIIDAHYYLKIHQMDVNMVFHNGNIDETIYMVQPKYCVGRPKEYRL